MKKIQNFGGFKKGFPWIFPVIFPICFPMIFMFVAHFSGLHGKLCARNNAKIVAPKSEPTALEILQKRFAAGEISAEEFQIAKEILEK